MEWRGSNKPVPSTTTSYSGAISSMMNEERKSYKTSLRWDRGYAGGKKWEGERKLGLVLSCPRGINEAVRKRRLNYLTGPPLVTCLQLAAALMHFGMGFVYFYHELTPDVNIRSTCRTNLKLPRTTPCSIHIGKNIDMHILLLHP